MSRSKRFLYNTLSTAGYQIVAMLMGFITPRLMMQYYGSEINGLVVSITEFINYFKLVEAGLASAAVYSLYKPLAEKDHDGISAIVSAARKFYHQAGYAFIGLTVLFACIYPIVVPCDSLDAISVGLLVLIMGISGTLEFFTLARYRVLLTADQKTYVVSLASMASLLVSTLLIVGLAMLQTNILVLRLAAGLTILVRSVALSTYVRRHYPYVNYKAAPNKSALSKRWDALYQQLTVSLQQSLGVILSTFITRDSKLVSVFGTYHMVVMGLWGILKMVTTGVYSFFGELIVKKKQDALQRVFRDFEYLYMSLCTVIYSVAAVMIVSFVRLYTSGVTDVDYIKPLWGILLVMQGLSDQLKTPLDLMVTAAGMFRETRHYNTIKIVLAITLGLVLGFIFGIPGMILGIIIANLVRTGLQLYFVPKYITKIPYQSSLMRMVRAYITVAIIAAPLLIYPLNPASYGSWIAMALGVTLYACGITLIMGLIFDRPALKALLKRAQRMVKK